MKVNPRKFVGQRVWTPSIFIYIYIAERSRWRDLGCLALNYLWQMFLAIVETLGEGEGSGQRPGPKEARSKSEVLLVILFYVIGWCFFVSGETFPDDNPSLHCILESYMNRFSSFFLAVMVMS